MEANEPIEQEHTNSFLGEVRPDQKGPKNIAIILVLSSLIVAGCAAQDWVQHQGGLTDDQLTTYLSTQNSQEGEPTSIEDFRDFESEVQQSNGFLIRSVGLALTTLCLIIGGVLLYGLKRSGAYLCVTGAGIGLITGVYGSLLIQEAAINHLGEGMLLTYKIWVYLCGTTMSLCLAIAALPLLNMRARLALSQKVILTFDESE